jgi:hypothetical protein
MDKLNKQNHILGRIALAVALLVIFAVPVTMMIVLQTGPDGAKLGSALINPAILIFFLSGAVEVITYSPLLGTSGTYLGFITGNLVNLKVPCAVNARELAGVKHGSAEGEIVSTISVATSTIVTTVIIALGVLFFATLESQLHILSNETLTPAFGSAFTALFAALGYKYFSKDPLLLPIPFTLALILAFAFNLGSSIILPICMIPSALFAIAIYKKQNKK